MRNSCPAGQQRLTSAANGTTADILTTQTPQIAHALLRVHCYQHLYAYHCPTAHQAAADFNRSAKFVTRRNTLAAACVPMAERQVDCQSSRQNVAFVHDEACQAAYGSDCKGTVVLCLSNSGLRGDVQVVAHRVDLAVGNGKTC